MSEHSYGIHRLINTCPESCITIQCYLNDERTGEYFSVVGRGNFPSGEDDFLDHYFPQNDWENYLNGVTAKKKEDRVFI